MVNGTWWEAGKLQIPLYSGIFLLAVLGNSLVILTLARNRSMRTVTNLFLLNLAVSDLFLGVLCMPPTLVGTLLRDFVFGHLMCRLIPYMQASSVSVSAWTLVCISVERYYAICHPLRARRWQTLSHVYKLIALVWTTSLLVMSPIALLSQLIPTSQGHHKCREIWPSGEFERGYTLLLDALLLVLPLFVLLATYFLIARTLWTGIRHQGDTSGESGETGRGCYTTEESLKRVSTNRSTTRRGSPGLLRRSNTEKALHKKKRVVKMLCAVVLEFFVCWTPLYVINTTALFEPSAVYDRLGYKGISFFQLLAYSSSCCNPITYCFMSSSFRKAFLNLFGCLRRSKPPL